MNDASERHVFSFLLDSSLESLSLGTNCDFYRCCLILILTVDRNCKFGHSYVSLSHDPLE